MRNWEKLWIIFFKIIKVLQNNSKQFPEIFRQIESVSNRKLLTITGQQNLTTYSTFIKTHRDDARILGKALHNSDFPQNR